jgi:hypothetical protein
MKSFSKPSRPREMAAFMECDAAEALLSLSSYYSSSSSNASDRESSNLDSSSSSSPSSSSSSSSSALVPDGSHVFLNTGMTEVVPPREQFLWDKSPFQLAHTRGCYNDMEGHGLDFRLITIEQCSLTFRNVVFATSGASRCFSVHGEVPIETISRDLIPLLRVNIPPCFCFLHLVRFFL